MVACLRRRLGGFLNHLSPERLDVEPGGADRVGECLIVCVALRNDYALERKRICDIALRVLLDYEPKPGYVHSPLTLSQI